MRELIDRLLMAWDNLSPRERILVGVSAALFSVAIFVLGIVQPILGYAESLELRAQGAEQQLQVMTRLRRDYDVVHKGLSEVEERIRTNQEKRNLLTLLESLAKSSAVKINSMEERKAQDDEKFKETRVEVRLKRVTLADTVSYLYAIEDSDRLLTVKSLKIRNRSDKSKLLDVNFNVSTFDTL